MYGLYMALVVRVFANYVNGKTFELEGGAMIKLFVADDHVVLREALCSMLSNRGNFEVVGQASDGAELLESLKTCQPDVVILDVAMPNVDGLQALAQMKNKDWACPPVLVLSADDATSNVRAVFKAGANGFMPKNARIEELVFAIESILEGRTYVSPSITPALLSDGGVDGGPSNLSKVLTKREIEILTYLADGKPNREIGKLLHISTRTVDTHRSNILKKLKVKTNAELVKIAIQNKLITV